MTDIEQMSLICQNLGNPSEASWPGAKGSLPHYLEFRKTVALPLKTAFPKVSHPSPLRHEVAFNTSVHILNIRVLSWACFAVMAVHIPSTRVSSLGPASLAVVDGRHGAA